MAKKKAAKKAAKRATHRRASATESMGPLADKMDSAAIQLKRVGTPTAKALAKKLESLAQSLRANCQVNMTYTP